MGKHLTRPLWRLTLAACLLCSQAAWSESPEAPGRLSADAIRTTDEADRILDQVRREREAVEERHAREEQACQEKFLVNACVAKADERRRAALEPLRADEVKADAFKRKARVVERDEALETKRQQVEADLPKHQEQGEASQRKAADEQGKREPGAARPAGKPASRVAEHEARMREREANAEADREQRARNVAAYEAKVRESEARQKAVAERLLEKQKKQAAREQEARARAKQGQ